MRWWQVLYEENREERKQLLDHMIFGTKDALPLPQLSQVCKLFLHTEAISSCLAEWRNLLGQQKNSLKITSSESWRKESTFLILVFKLSTPLSLSLSLSLSLKIACAKPILFNPHFMSRLFSPAHHCPQRVLIMFLWFPFVCLSVAGEVLNCVGGARWDLQHKFGIRASKVIHWASFFLLFLNCRSQFFLEKKSIPWWRDSPQFFYTPNLSPWSWYPCESFRVNCGVQSKDSCCILCQTGSLESEQVIDHCHLFCGDADT